MSPAVPIRFGIVPRVTVLGFLFALELLLLTYFLRAETLLTQHGLARLMGIWGAWTLRSAVAVVTVFVVFGYVRARAAIESMAGEIAESPVGWGSVWGHVGAIAVLAVLSAILFRDHSADAAANFLAVGWLLAGVAAIVLGAMAVLPARLWIRLAHSLGNLWIYAAVAGAGAGVAGHWTWSFWEPASRLTFALVKQILRPFLATVVSDPASLLIGSQRFKVVIARECSGLEGAGLMLVFSLGWLWFFRKECRFPQALLLVPGGIATIWLMNSVRIAALILIGNAGAPGVAMGGFHSQAGWIAFNLVALGFLLTVRYVPWLMVRQSQPVAATVRGDNPTAPYLVPFLAILAASMISRSASSGFEWMYPLRFLAAAGALWMYRDSYRRFDWRFGWEGPAIGCVVFGLWMALEPASASAGVSVIGGGLAHLPVWGRFGWIVFRALAAVVTVPIAEELAFRSFLMRRVGSADFESVDPRRFHWLGILVSSVAFGMMHGDRWIAGIAAGFLFALAYARRGRLGDAVIAHAVTNGLLATLVLAGGKWYLW